MTPPKKPRKVGTRAGAKRKRAKGTPAKIATKATAPRKRPKGRPRWAAAFLKELENNGGHITNAAASIPVNRVTVYRLRFDDEEFAEEWDLARRAGKLSIVHRIEDNALLRAAEGVEEFVGWFQGEPGATVRKWNDNLVLALLRAHLPTTYNIPQGDPTAGTGGLTAEQQAAKIRDFVAALDDSVPKGDGDG